MRSSIACFATPIGAPLPSRHGTATSAPQQRTCTPACPKRSRTRTRTRLVMSDSTNRDNDGSAARLDDPLFDFTGDDAWMVGPLTAEQEANVRSRLPGPVADFILRRASDEGRDPADTLMGKLARDAARAGGVDEEIEKEYEDYVYEADKDSRRSVFVGNETQADLEARRVGYAALALFLFVVLLRIAAGLATFFVKFTFSFAAIFALSAGIFVVFVLFRF